MPYKLTSGHLQYSYSYSSKVDLVKEFGVIKFFSVCHRSSKLLGNEMRHMTMLKYPLSWSAVSNKVKAIAWASQCLIQCNDPLSAQTHVCHLLILGLCRLQVAFAQQTWHLLCRHLFPLQQQSLVGLDYRIFQISQYSHGQQLQHLVKSNGCL